MKESRGKYQYENEKHEKINIYIGCCYGIRVLLYL